METAGISLPGEPSYARDIRSLRESVERLRQSFLNQPKQATAAAAGGIVGQAYVAASSGTVKAYSGETSMRYTDVTYTTPTDPTGLADPWWVSTSGRDITLEPGWYGAVALFRLAWSTEAASPSSFDLYMGGGFDTPHLDSHIIARTRLAASQWGIYHYVNLGTVYAHGAAEPDYLFHAEIRFPGQAAGADSVAGDVEWTFTKFA